jgi:hypothetical protein
MPWTLRHIEVGPGNRQQVNEILLRRSQEVATDKNTVRSVARNRRPITFCLNISMQSPCLCFLTAVLIQRTSANFTRLSSVLSASTPSRAIVVRDLRSLLAKRATDFDSDQSMTASSQDFATAAWQCA